MWNTEVKSITNTSIIFLSCAFPFWRIQQLVWCFWGLLGTGVKPCVISLLLSRSSGDLKTEMLLERMEEKKIVTEKDDWSVPDFYVVVTDCGFLFALLLALN